MSLFGEELVTRTKFLVPTPKRAHLDRERLYARLDAVNEAALGLIVAGTGYGKTALLAGYLRARQTPALWYEPGELDADPQVFLLHLAHLFGRRFPGAGDRPLALLAQPGGAQRHGVAAVDALADALLDHLMPGTWLVLDEAHRLAGSPTLALVDQLIRARPPQLHVVMLSRQKLELPDLPRWRLEGEVVSLSQRELAFTEPELAEWQARVEGGRAAGLDAAARHALWEQTEGWPMALALTGGPADGHAAASREDLFSYLAREVLAALSPEDLALLEAVAPLSRIPLAVCEALLPGAHARLQALDERGLFLLALPEGGYRLHTLFQACLLARLGAMGGLVAARRAAGGAALAAGELEEAVEQWLAAGDFEAAAGVMAMRAPRLVDQGRFGQLAAWLDALPPALLDRAPALAICQGDACRLSARFEAALAWYERALKGYPAASPGQARALAGQALVFLDTLEPARAASLLEAAIACAPSEQQGELVALLAENKLNLGDVVGARAALAGQQAPRPDAAVHEARVQLRTGRLADARRTLARAIAHQDPALVGTRAHREPALVLSLVLALEGNAQGAAELAREVSARAAGSPWTAAVAAIRLGHALLLQGELGAAREAYTTGDDQASAPRLRAEPMLGLALVASREGQVGEAERLTTAALAATRATGDVWVSAMLALGLGKSYAARGDARALAWLAMARADYAACDDAFGLALVTLAEARLALTREAFEAAFAAAREHPATLKGPTLLGFEDEAAIAAFVARAAALGVSLEAAPAPGEAEPEPALVAPAPGPSRPLRVFTLGGFGVERDGAVLPERAWGREKARQLFQLLVIHRGRRLSKLRLIGLLWPDLDASAADGTFRVALNALNKALEPDRKGGTPTRYVLRDGATYGLAGEVEVDATAFELALDAAREQPEALAAALARYEGPFLPDLDHEEAVAERERLSTRYTEGALALARLLSRAGDHAGCAAWAQKLLARDRCCEEAYRFLMLAQHEGGDRGLAIRTYDRCVVALSDELDVDPMPETQALYEAIAGSTARRAVELG